MTRFMTRTSPTHRGQERPRRPTAMLLSQAEGQVACVGGLPS